MAIGHEPSFNQLVIESGRLVFWSGKILDPDVARWDVTIPGRISALSEIHVISVSDSRPIYFTKTITVNASEEGVEGDLTCWRFVTEDGIRIITSAFGQGSQTLFVGKRMFEELDVEPSVHDPNNFIPVADFYGRHPGLVFFQSGPCTSTIK